MQPVARTWITPKRPALGARFELFGRTRHLAPTRPQATDVQAPVGLQVIHAPIITLHPRQALVSLLEMSNQVGGLPGGTDGPGHLPCGHGQRVDQHWGTMTHVLVCTPLASPRWCRLGGRLALQHWPAGFCIAADHPTAWLIALQRRDVEWANRVGVGLAVLVMALVPVRTLVRLAIDVVQDAPDA
jgi:hypothetical protein